MELKPIKAVLSGVRLFLIMMTAAAGAVLSGGCAKMPDYADSDSHDPYANFDALADIVGSRYCFFAEKEIDWGAMCASYRKKITSKTTEAELFFILSDLLDELKDGHVNLISPFATSYYKKWWSDYPQDFDNRVLQEHYLHFGGLQTSGMQYVMFVPDSIGYLRYPSFSATVGETNLDYVLAILQKSKGLIIDVRDNGGGDLSNVPTLVSRFIKEKTTGGYIRHKTGPAQDAFSAPYPIEYEPCGDGRVSYDGPVMILTNRSTFSAANDFVSVMKDLPQVRICGARTGGGGGMPFSSELPNGWAIRFSASPISDASDRSTEDGIDPTPGYGMHCTPEEFAKGKDAILDLALRTLASEAPSDHKGIRQ